MSKDYKNITGSDVTVSLYFSPGAGGADTRGLTIDTNDVVYTADRLDHRVYKLVEDEYGNITRTLLAGSTYGILVNGNGSEAKFNSIIDIQSDRQNNIYVVEPGVSVIRKITPNGDVTHYAGTTIQYEINPSSSPLNSGENHIT